MAQEHGKSVPFTMKEEITWLRSLVAMKEEQLVDLEQEGKELTSNCVILMDNSRVIVSHICEIIQELTATVDVFKRSLQTSGKSGCVSPVRKQQNIPMPDSTGGLPDLGACVEEFMSVTRSANSCLAKASADWEKSQETMRLLKAKTAKIIVRKILKKKVRIVKAKDDYPQKSAKPGAFETGSFPIRSGCAEEEHSAAKGPGPYRLDFPRDFRIKEQPNPRKKRMSTRIMSIPEIAKNPTPGPDSMENTKAAKTPDEANPEEPSTEGSL